jgi:hypothetical protein
MPILQETGVADGPHARPAAEVLDHVVAHLIADTVQPIQLRHPASNTRRHANIIHIGQTSCRFSQRGASPQPH